ncbi:MAG: hypothetical protein QXD77_00240 [Candidatus Aenigmatarchaeota archaeon]
MPREDGLKVTDEARVVAREISVRGCFWTDGYSESFAEYADRIRLLGGGDVYLNGAKSILNVCGGAGDKDPAWGDLKLNPSDRASIKYCCEKIIDIMR